MFFRRRRQREAELLIAATEVYKEHGYRGLLEWVRTDPKNRAKVAGVVLVVDEEGMV